MMAVAAAVLVAAAYLLIASAAIYDTAMETVRLVGGPLDGCDVEVARSVRKTVLEHGRRKEWRRYGDQVVTVDVVDVAVYRRVVGNTFAFDEDGPAASLGAARATAIEEGAS